MSGVRQPRPVLNSPAQLLEPHACGVLWGQPARIWGCSFCGLPFSPALLSSHDTPGGGQPQVFGLQRHSWLSLLQDPLVHLPGGPQSSPATPSSRGISRFLSAVAVQRPCPGVGPGSVRVCAISALVPNDIFALGDLCQFLCHCPSESQPSCHVLAAVSIYIDY